MSEPPLSILYVDDEPLLLDTIKKYLTKQGFIVDIAVSGIQALQKISDTPYDVIVSDYQMPEMDGIELLKEIRREYPDIPFILFTGRGSEEVVIDAIENGADFYIRKGGTPVPQLSDLSDKIRVAIQRRREIRALRESEWKFGALVEYSLDGTFILDPRGTILFANSTAVQILDIQNPSELIGNRNVMEFVTPESIDDVIRDFDTVAGGVDGYIAQYKILTENHEERWVESIGKTILYQDAPSILISLRDVTDRKLAEDMQRKTSHEMQQIFTNMTNAFIVWESVFDENGKYVSFRFGYFNDAFARISRLHYGDVQGKDVFEVWPGTEPSWIEVYGQVAVTGVPHTFDMYHEPTKGWYHCNAYRPTDSPDQICAILEDITESRLTGELLRETNAYLDNLITNANVPIIVWDPSFHITRINHSFELLIGRLEQDILSKSISVLFHPDHVDYYMQLIDTTRDGVRWETLQLELQHKNGSIKAVLWNSSTIYGPDGSTPIATIAQGRDITVEQLLKKEKEAATLQIQDNIAQLAILNDGIRNPLTVISVYLDQINDPKIIETIQSQIRLIDTMVFNLDKKWIQSEKILEYLRKQGQIIDGLNQISPSLVQGPGDSLQKNPGQRIYPLSKNPLFSEEIMSCQFSSRIIMDGGPNSLSSIEGTSESTAEKSAFEALVRSMVGTTGINALQKITENISSWLKADCVMVGEIQPDKKTVLVLSMLLDGKEISDFSYSLKGTPCEDVTEKGFCLYPDNAALLFPESKDLRELDIRGYMGTPLWNSEGEVFGILCALFRDPIKPLHSVREIMDIIAVKAAAEIERTQIEQILRENQHVLAEAMNMANLVSWEFDVIKELFTFNEPFYALYGTTAEREGGDQMTRETYAREFIYPEDLPHVAEEVEKAIHTTDPDFLLQQEHRIIRRDGEIRDISVRLRIIKDAQGRTIKTHGVNQDITERRRSEEVIRRANRQLNLLTSITRHDILNNISVVYVLLELLKQKFADPELLEHLRVMVTATEDIQSQIEFTRVYEELGSHEPLWVQLDTIMPRSSLPDSITLMKDVPDMYLFADPMVQKVFFALLDNSVRHGQRVTRIRVSMIESENNLTVMWEDNGVGIVQEEKERIFERGLGRNTGLGLFLAREILSLTGITIMETGVFGTGARFEIHVPRGTFRRINVP